MATVKQILLPANSAPVGTVFPDFRVEQGTNFPVTGLYYLNAVNQRASWKTEAVSYGSGNITLNIAWYAIAATSGTVLFTAQMAALTPNVDTQDIETKALATANTVTDTHLGTTAKRLHNAVLVITNTDSVAADDEIYIVLERTGSDASIAENIVVTKITLTYSDT